MYPSQLIFLSFQFFCTVFCLQVFCWEIFWKSYWGYLVTSCFSLTPLKILLLSLFLITVCPMWVSLNFLLLGFHWTYYMYTYSCCSSSLGNVWPLFIQISLLFSLLFWNSMIIYWSTWWRPINSLSLFTFLRCFFFLFCLSDLIISNFFMLIILFLSTCLNVLLNFSSEFFNSVTVFFSSRI